MKDAIGLLALAVVVFGCLFLLVNMPAARDYEPEGDDDEW